MTSVYTKIVRCLKVLAALALATTSNEGRCVDFACEKEKKSVFNLNSIDSTLSRFLLYLKCPACADIHLACDLSKLTPLPEVVFVGETHGNTNSVNVKFRLFRMALEKKIVVASEVAINGGLAGWLAGGDAYRMNASDSGTFHGIESSIPYSLIQSYYIQRGQFSGSDLSEPIYQQIYAILTLPLQRWVYEELKINLSKTPKGASISTLFKEIDRALTIVEKVGKNPPYASIVSEASKAVGEKVAGPSEFLGLMHRGIIRTVNEKYSDRMGGVRFPVVNSQKDLVAFGLTNTDILPDSIAHHLFIEVRNRDFSAEIGNLLCRYSGQSQKIFVLLGADHLEGIEKNLKFLSDDRIKTQKYYSAIVSDADVIFKLLSNTKP